MTEAKVCCPVCRQPIHEGTGWAVRHSGRWLHFRSRACVEVFEAHPDAYVASADNDRPASESPCSEWACY